MGDRVGLIIMALFIVGMITGFAVFGARKRRADGRKDHDTLNAEAETTTVDQGKHGRRSGEIPYDTLTPDGSGTAIAGAGAGGRTTDGRDPLTGGAADSSTSPDT